MNDYYRLAKGIACIVYLILHTHRLTMASSSLSTSSFAGFFLKIKRSNRKSMCSENFYNENLFRCCCFFTMPFIATEEVECIFLWVLRICTNKKRKYEKSWAGDLSQCKPKFHSARRFYFFLFGLCNCLEQTLMFMFRHSSIRFDISPEHRNSKYTHLEQTAKQMHLSSTQWILLYIY